MYVINRIWKQTKINTTIFLCQNYITQLKNELTFTESLPGPRYTFYLTLIRIRGRKCDYLDFMMCRQTAECKYLHQDETSWRGRVRRKSMSHPRFFPMKIIWYIQCTICSCLKRLYKKHTHTHAPTHKRVMSNCWNLSEVSRQHQYSGHDTVLRSHKTLAAGELGKEQAEIYCMWIYNYLKILVFFKDWLDLKKKIRIRWSIYTAMARMLNENKIIEQNTW